jgi:hypothetical protein
MCGRYLKLINIILFIYICKQNNIHSINQEGLSPFGGAGAGVGGGGGGGRDFMNETMNDMRSFNSTGRSGGFNDDDARRSLEFGRK